MAKAKAIDYGNGEIAMTGAQNDSELSTGKSSKLWVVVRIFAVISLLASAFMALGTLNRLSGGVAVTPYLIVLFLIIAIMIGSILLIVRKKLAGILLVLIGAVAVVLFVTSAFSGSKTFASDLPMYLILTIAPSIILLIFAFIAKK